MRSSSCFRKEIDILIDAHMHVFDIQQLSLSPKKLRYVPEKSASFEEYHSLAEPRGITGCLVVQPSFLGTHNGYISQFLNAEKEIFGVAVVEPRISFPELKSLSIEVIGEFDGIWYNSPRRLWIFPVRFSGISGII